ncbi:MAG: hypothetical protein AB1393_10935 [Candidatus Edwardsbacteria bacterium]
MKPRNFNATKLLILLATVSLLWQTKPLFGEVKIEVNIGLPKLVITREPEVILIPGTYVYFIPDIETEIFFYHGYWFRPFKGKWYRAVGYNGSWIILAVGSVPKVLLNLPPGYRKLPPGQTRIPYGQLKKNWKTWEKQKPKKPPEIKKSPESGKKKGGRGK